LRRHGRRLRNRQACSWALFVFFPLNLAYAFTAMAEMTVTASVLAALAVFLAIPSKWKAWLGPITLAIPLLFRETGAVVVLVMAAVIYQEPRKPAIRRGHGVPRVSTA
jgi:hypothetical protein